MLASHIGVLVSYEMWTRFSYLCIAILPCVFLPHNVCRDMKTSSANKSKPTQYLLYEVYYMCVFCFRAAVCLEEREGEEGSGLEQQPHFLHDHLTLNVSVQLGSTAHLHCRLAGITDQSVSTPPSTPHITHHNKINPQRKPPYVLACVQVSPAYILQQDMTPSFAMEATVWNIQYILIDQLPADQTKLLCSN